MATKDQLITRAKQMVFDHLILSMSPKDLCEKYDLSQPGFYRFVGSEEYQEQKRDLQSKLDVQYDNFFSETDVRMKKMIEIGLARFQDILETSLNEGSVIRVTENLMDRVGIARQQKSEVKHTVELSEATLNLMMQAERELHTTIELRESEFSYATNKPDDATTRRRITGEVAPEGPTQHVLHGEGSNRFQGSGSESPRDDGQLDRQWVEEEARLSPS